MARLLAGPARLPRSAVAIVLTLLGSSPLYALEKALTVAPQDEAWECASVCGDYLSYYNTCTGWVWAWSGFEPGDVIGHTAAEGDLCFTYMTSRIYVTRGAPPGYGYTGEIRLSNYDDDSCPAGATVRAYPFLPTTGWNVTTWGGVGSAIAHTALIQIVMGEGADNPVALASDVGASGGPPACGTCYPTTREPHSFYYGTETDPLCPGEPFFDGCPVQLLVDFCYDRICDIQYDCDAAVSVSAGVDASSWGRVKSLYR